MFLALDSFLWGGSSSSSTAGAGLGYHLLLAMWSDQWIPGSASATASVSVSISIEHSHDHDGGHGHHHRKHWPGWFDNGRYRIADEEYWTEREKMLRRYAEPPHRGVPAEEPEVVKLQQQHVRLLQEVEQVFDLDSLKRLLEDADRLSTQISDIQLQSDEEAILALLLS